MSRRAPHRAGRPRIVRTLGACGMVGLGLLPALGASRPRPAAAEGSFSGVSAADGVQAAVTSRGFLIVEGGAAGLPSAQAAVDSLGQSVAYAAFPYPTDAALTVPGLVASAGGPALPRYPLIAQSSHPVTPSAAVEAGPVHLRAESTERSSRGQAEASPAGAKDGTAIGRTATDAGVVANPAGPVTSTGESTVEAFSTAGGTLRIGRVHSEATVVRAPGDEPRVTSHLEVAQVTVAGQTVGFGDGGLGVPGGPQGALANPLAAALADAGITVRYLAPVHTPDGGGVVSAGIEVQVTRQVTGTGPTTVSYVLGRSFAHVGAVTAPAVPDAGSVAGSGDEGVPSGAASAGRSAGAGAGSPAVSGSPLAGSGSSPAWSSGSPPTEGSESSGASSVPGGSHSGTGGAAPTGSTDAGSPSGPSLVAAPAADDRHVGGFEVGGSYLLLVLAALATAGGAQLLRILGVNLA